MIQMRFKVVGIGVSTGAFKALSELLPSFPRNFPSAIMVVCHRQQSPDNYLTKYLSSICSMEVRDIENLAAIEPGFIYISPPGYHALIADDFTFNLSADPPVNFSRPSIDVLFETEAEVYGNSGIGVILTGANSDGAAGLAKIKAAGGYAIVQNPNSAESRIMPEAAIHTTQVDFIGSLSEISEHLCDIFSVQRIVYEK